MTVSETVSKNKCTSMVSEYLVLVDIASQLGTYILNKNAPDVPINATKQSEANKVSIKDVREEAELLLKFMSSIPLSSSRRSDDFKDCKEDTNLISPSLSFEASQLCSEYEEIQSPSSSQSKLKPMRHIDIKESSLDPDQSHSQKNSFTIHCPSLSLQSSSSLSSLNTPSQLFSQQIIAQCSSNVNSISEQLAHNVLNSFLSALKWRNRVWIKSLADVIVKRHQHRIIKRRNQGESKESLESFKGEIRKSKEARLIEALAHASSAVVVHDVRNTFEVLEKQLSFIDKVKKNESLPPLKKRRKTSPLNSKNEYKLSHAINLESKCTVSANNEKAQVILKTPGAIHGTFHHDVNGHLNLVDVSLTLDTEILATSIEQQSRKIMRAAAKECMISPPTPPITHTFIHESTEFGMVSDVTSLDESTEESEVLPSEEQSDSYLFTPKTTSDCEHLPCGALITPVDQGISTGDSMPPPPPRLPLDVPTQAEKIVLNPRRVSPTTNLSNFGDTNGKCISPKPSDLDFLPPLSPKLKRSFPQTYLIPSIVSPLSPPEECIQRNDKAIELIGGPSLPVLVEVACAAHAQRPQ